MKRDTILSFGDLAQCRAQFGVTQLLVEYAGQSPVEVYVTAMGHFVEGWGENEFDAINDAFNKLARKVEKSFQHASEATS
jgi:hypothetical protein